MSEEAMDLSQERIWKQWTTFRPALPSTQSSRHRVTIIFSRGYMNWPVQFTPWVKKAWKFTSTDTTSVRAARAWRQIDLLVVMMMMIIIIVIISIHYLFTNVLAEKEKCCYIASTNTQIKHKYTKRNIKKHEDVTQEQKKWCFSIPIPFHHDTVHCFLHSTAESGKVRCLFNKTIGPKVTLTPKCTKTNDQYCWIEWKHRSAAVKVHRITTFFLSSFFP